MTNTDFLDLFVDRLGLAEPERNKLKVKIAAYVFERTAILLRDQLSSDEQDAMASFLKEPTAENQGQVQVILSSPERQAVFADAMLAVLGDLMNEPEVVTAEQRDAILLDMEQFLESRLTLAQ